MKTHLIAWLMVALAAPAAAGEAPLVLKGTATYYGLRVPLAVRAQTRAADLSDIQVLDARGQPLPYAWVNEPAEAESQTHEQNVPFFSAPATVPAASATTSTDPSQQGGWILDTRGVKGVLMSLQLTVPASTHGLYSFTLESSDDLQQWRTVRSSAQLVSLQQQGLRLDHSLFELGGLRTSYLRLRPLSGSTPPPLASALVNSVMHYTPALPVQWSDPLTPTQCTAQHCDYTLPRHMALEQLEWQLAQANTLAPVELLAQYDASEADANAQPTRRHHHLVREQLSGLRHKTAPAATEYMAWVPLQQTTAYWLRLPEGELRSPPLALPGGQITQLRVQPAGGMAQLGSSPPTIRVGSRAASLVFLAREPSPYRLAWGGNTASTALPLSQLMPTRQANEALPSDTAMVLMEHAPAASAAPSSGARPATTPAIPSRKLWLWAVLLAALALMGYMARSLLRAAPKA